MSEQQYVVDLDQEMCMGSGVCVSYAPKAFGIGSNAKAVVVQPIAANSRDVEVAVSACPTGAITLTRRPDGAADDGTEPVDFSERKDADSDR
jgi:ferredoxin